MSGMEFLTSDLQLASYLAALGHDPVRVEGPVERRVFVFREVPQDDVSSYYRGTRSVSPQKLFTAYRTLKRQLFQPV